MYFTMNNTIIFKNVTRIKIKFPREHIQSRGKCWEWMTFKSKITTCTTLDFQKKRSSSTLPTLIISPPSHIQGRAKVWGRRNCKGWKTTSKTLAFWKKKNCLPPTPAVSTTHNMWACGRNNNLAAFPHPESCKKLGTEELQR